MALRKFKQIADDIEALAPVTNKEALFAAIPLLTEMNERISTMRKTIKSHAELAKKLNDACSKYALAHVSSVFVGSMLTTDGKGVKHGDVDLDGTTYHFSAGYGKLARTDGDNMTQEFLDSLPEEWTKGKVELDQTAITTLGVSVDELFAKGLYKPENNVWSRVVVADAGE